MKRLAVFVSDTGSNLARIIASCEAGEIGAKVVVVVCNVPGAGAIAIAEAAGIPVAVLDHRAAKDRSAHERAIVAALAPHRVDLVVLAGYMRVLSPWLISKLHVPALGHARAINLHPADPALYRGADGYGWAFAAGIARTAVTVHWVDEGLDAGPTIASAHVEILPNDSLESLKARGQAVEHALLPTGIRAALARLDEVLAPCAAAAGRTV
jgi:phosphoribosylglycinamide formyltransferase-1